jgi:hypothetical protein
MMSQSLEDLVRAAQHEQAERAVDPQRVLAALPQRRARVVRRRRLVLALAAAAVVAVLAPVLALRPGPPPQPPSVTPSPVPSVTGPQSRFVPLEFSPGWLPAGYAEYYRSIRPREGLIRVWGSAPPPSPLLIDDVPRRLSMTVAAAGESEVTRDESDETVEINGSSGGYRTDGPPGVYWQTGGFTIEIRADQPGITRDTMLRIARSVRSDPAGTELPMVVGIPAGQVSVAQSVTGVSPGEWLAVTDLGEEDPFGSAVASGTSVSVGTVTPAPAGGTSLRVGGRPARHLYAEVPEGGHYLVVELGGGLRLTVFSLDLDRPAMVALAEAAGAPNPTALTWIGR